MPHEFLHQDKEFADLIRIVGIEHSVDPILVEKDYWIMHCLYGLQQMGLSFELKGGTSLSKGYGIIERFSEDIDIRIEPPRDMKVATNPNQQKKAHDESRKAFYDWLAGVISIDGITSVVRDHEFDDEHYRSGGIRLHYDTHIGTLAGLKDGILLEIGFDVVTPNMPRTISSWAYDFAADKTEVADNRAVDVACYLPGYTFVEKLQTISTKFRQQQEEDDFPANFMRHYYDVFCLLQAPEVRTFIGTKRYKTHKQNRFRKKDNLVLAENEAFLISDPATREIYTDEYARYPTLYYAYKPEFATIMSALAEAVTIEGI